MSRQRGNWYDPAEVPKTREEKRKTLETFFATIGLAETDPSDDGPIPLSAIDQSIPPFCTPTMPQHYGLQSLAVAQIERRFRLTNRH